MTDERGRHDGNAPVERTLSSAAPEPVPTEQFGIETRLQKAELEAALFGDTPDPVSIAHYTVIGTLGSGGMGVVYVAHDQRLDRRVALKLLRHTHAGLLARTRLQREAQAMARLSHPHVVTVHEVGMYAGQVFIAMEFVGGGNLRAWLKAQPRGWREIVAMFLQAGEGLVAAHAAGIIHRDFKPDNVLVGDDGRVRVADFGLAHGLGADTIDPTPEPSIPGDPVLAVSLDSPLTETGAIIGTPAYMAPEQHLGTRVDERSDQFAFCVALWEALYGRRPFTGTTVAELIAALRDDRITEPLEPGDVPPWLQLVIRRGLARSPDGRWPSMRELLTALARDPDRIRRRRLRAAGLTSVIVAIIAVLSVRALAASHHGARQRYWSTLTEQLLEIERERGLRQANDDAARARKATRMSGYRRYRPQDGWVDHEDPTVAAALLREVEAGHRSDADWISAANEILGQPISYAVLAGHRNVIVDIAFAPDSTEVYTAAKDNEVWRWDIATGRGTPIIRHEREVVSIAVSPDGRYLASGARDRRVQLWDRQRPDHAELVAELDGELTKLAFDPTGQWLAMASRAGPIELLRLADRKSRSFVGHVGAVHDLAFDEHGQLLLSAGADRSARVWRVSDGEQQAVLGEHGDQVFHARFIDAAQVVTGCDDGGVRAWRWREPDAGEVLTQYQDAVTALDVRGSRVASASLDGGLRIVELVPRTIVDLKSPNTVWSVQLLDDGRQLVTGSFDGRAYLWSTHGGAPRRTFVGHREAVLRVVVDAEARWLATGSYDTELRLWDLERPSLRDTLVGHSYQIADIAIDRAQQRVATGAHDSAVLLWDLDDGRELARMRSDGEVYTLAFSPDDRLLAVGARSGMLALWQFDEQRTQTLVGHEQDVWQVRFDSVGERLVSASIDGTIRVWSVADGRELLVLRGHGDAVTAAHFEPGDRRIISAGSDGTVRIWDADDGRPLAVLDAHTSNIWQLVRSPDGRTLATASDDGTARLWPSDDPAQSIVLRGHRQAVRAIAFDRLGERIVTASSDGDAKLWRVADGVELRTFTGHGATVWSAVISIDGRVITASEDNSIRVWPIDPEQPAIVLSGHVDAVTALALTGGGTRLISGSADATAKIWHIDELSTQPERLHRQLREATIWCLSVDRRMRELGEDEAEATHAFEDCERAYGRR